MAERQVVVLEHLLHAGLAAWELTLPVAVIVGKIRHAAERLRVLIERLEIKPPQLDRVIRIKVSIGVAVYPRDGATSADLVEGIASFLQKRPPHFTGNVRSDLPQLSEWLEGGKI